MTTSELKKTLSFTENLAQKVGEYLLDNQKKVTVLNYKNRQDILTNIDVGAEKIIIEAIEKKFPNHSIYSEEKGHIDKDSDYQWVLDPLDGTKYYVRDLPIYNTAINLLYRGKSILAVSYRPVEKQLYSAIKKGGFYYNGNRYTVSQTEDIYKSFLFVGLPNSQLEKNDYERKMEQFKKVNWASYRVRCLADSMLGMGATARGAFDAFVDLYGKEKIWDVIAGILFVTEAGGVVTDLNGDQIQNNDTSKGILATNGKIHNELLSLLKL
ncbi:hypothetical protein A2011_01840 [candidate division CPR3 bacterium GWE2_35_7]|nr:MAG: hypothetical protein A2011_01840 [candidate division CPR3 bacterium GWE2_35_7]